MHFSLPLRVVLVGGSSSVGKTTLAQELARRVGGEHVQIDDLRGSVDDPRVRFFSDTRNPWQLDPLTLCGVLQRAAEAMRPRLGAVIDAALARQRRLVLEGEGLDPSLAARYSSDLRVCALFIVELDGDRLAHTFRARSPSFARLSAAEQATVARTCALYGRSLQTDCRKRRLTCLPAQPWATLADRAMGIVGQDRLAG